jgi:hypothetical protein
LTYLELTGGPAGPGGLHNLQELTGLQGLTRLQDLLLDSLGAQIILASTLSGLQQVTRLKLHGVAGSSEFEPGEGFVSGCYLNFLSLLLQSQQSFCQSTSLCSREQCSREQYSNHQYLL